MQTVPVNPTLAESIGRDRIAIVVDQFYDRIQAHPNLAQPFGLVEDWPEHKDRLTYFWWITLGGKREREVNFDVVPKHWKAGFSAALLQDWIAAFRQVVFTVVDKDLGEAWMEKVSRLANTLLISNESYKARLATPVNSNIARIPS